jgi:hypothetical protein
MLTAYLDETGHEGKDLVVLAGFLGDEDQWKKCEAEWRVGLGKKKHLHMKKLRWSESKPHRHKELLDRLGSIPHSAGLQAIYSAVRVADYEDLLDGTQMQKLMKGYFVTLLGIIDIVAKNIPPEETFKLVLEIQQEYAAGAYQIYLGMKARTPDGRRKLISLEFIEKDQSSLAEPGDYLAYALLQKYRDSKSLRCERCAPILENTRPALARNHLNERETLRKFVRGLIVKYPDLMRSTT